MKPLVSFIIPVYKVEEEYLKKAITSLINVKNENIEIILVDDGAPDNCGKICDFYANSDKRVKAFHKKNGGVSNARNFGINYSNGEYITFIDSDDWIESEKMDAILSEVKKKQYDVYLHGQYIDFKNQHPIEIRPFNEEHLFRGRREIDELQKMIFVRDFKSMRTNMGSGVVCNAVDKYIRKSIVLENSCFFNENIHMGEDALFYLNLFQYCESAKYINLCVYHYRMRQNSACHTVSNIGYQNIAVFCSEAKKMFDEQRKDDSFKEALYYRCFDLVLEQFDRAYLDIPKKERNIYMKIKMLNSELSKSPFKEVLSIIDLKNYSFKNGLKAFMFKHRMAGVFLVFKQIKRELHLDDREKKSYY